MLLKHHNTVKADKILKFYTAKITKKMEIYEKIRGWYTAAYYLKQLTSEACFINSCPHLMNRSDVDSLV